MKTFRRILDAVSILMLVATMETRSATTAAIALVAAASALGIGFAESRRRKWQ